MKSVKLLTLCLVLFYTLHLSVGLPSRRMFILWKPPDGRPRPEYFATFGLSKKEFETLKEKMPVLRDLMTETLVATKDMPTETAAVFRQRKDDTIKMDDIILTVSQVNRMISLYKGFIANLGRGKRKIVDFDKEPEEMWDISKPIPYVIDGSFKAKNQDKIVEAIKHWEENTCIRFVRKFATDEINDHHIVFFNEQGCGSHLGRIVEELPQPIFLSEDVCLPVFGVGVHEIGHAMGFLHEQARIGRLAYINIDFNNLPNTNSTIDQFAEWVDGFQKDFGLPYDFGSIMHYGAFDFAFDPDIPVITTKDPLFQKTMGQRVGLSFSDIKAVNLAYCSDKCKPKPNCQRGGIPHPNACKTCLCPDGFGGATCQTVASNHHSGCTSPQIIHVTSQEKCVVSPNYGSEEYPVGAKCNWHLTAPNNRRIRLFFKGEFGVHCVKYDEYCYHWVEIKFKGNVNTDRPGPRFCCAKTPPNQLVSDGNLVVVTFRSDIDTKVVRLMPKKRVGFQLCFRLAIESAGMTPSLTTPLTTPTPSCIRLLYCSTFDSWQIKTKPKLSTQKIKKVIEGCPGEHKVRGNTIRFDIGFLSSGKNGFKLVELCVKRSEVKYTVISVQGPASGSLRSLPLRKTHIIKLSSNKNCITASDLEGFGKVIHMSITLKRKKKKKLKVWGIKASINIC